MHVYEVASFSTLFGGFFKCLKSVLVFHILQCIWDICSSSLYFFCMIFKYHWNFAFKYLRRYWLKDSILFLTRVFDTINFFSSILEFPLKKQNSNPYLLKKYNTIHRNDFEKRTKKIFLFMFIQTDKCSRLYNYLSSKCFLERLYRLFFV